MPDAYTRTSIVTLTEGERGELTSMARLRSLPAALALRARIVMACEGADKASTEGADALGIDRNTVNKWRGRYVRDRVSGLYDDRARGTRCVPASVVRGHGAGMAGRCGGSLQRKRHPADRSSCGSAYGRDPSFVREV